MAAPLGDSSATVNTASEAFPGGLLEEERPKYRLLSGGFLRAFMEHRTALVGLGFLAFMLLFCFVGPLVYTTNQVNANVVEATLPPSAAHLLGTDQSGFDVLGRLMLGGQTSLEIGLGAAFLGALLGVAWGAAAGFVGGVVDAAMMRVVDAVLSIPALLLLMVVAVIIVPSALSLIVIIALEAWPAPARLVRGETLSLKAREYVDAARGFGSGRWRLIRRHIVPNAVGTVLVNATFQVADAILLVAYLSFLGLGIPPPAANWGTMLSGGLDYAFSGYWWLIYPAGLAIVLTVMAVNFVGDGLRDSLEVRTHRV